MLIKRLLQVTLCLLVWNFSVVEAALIAPSDLTAAPYSSGSIALSWVGASQGNVNYVIERSTSPAAGFATIGSTSWTETVYLDAGLPAGTTYYYRVRVLYAGSTSAYSNVASAATTGGVTTTTPGTSSTSTTAPTTSTSTTRSTTSTSSTSTSRTTTSTSTTRSTTSTSTTAPTTSTSTTRSTTSTSSTSTSRTTTSTSTTRSTTSTSTPTTSTSTTKTTSTTSTTTSTTMAAGGPVANAGPDQLIQTLTMVTFDGSGSFDPGGTINSYAWTFGDGAAGSGMSTSHAYATPGTYTASLTVTDSRGLKATDTASALVANRPPVANAGPDQTQPVGAAVSLNGTGTDPDGTVTAYAWSFGDGTSGAGAAATHVYTTAGTYTATLTVTDDRGAQGSDTAIVTVTAGGAASPWTRRFGSAGADVSFGVAADAAGNVVMTGRVEQSTDLGGVVCPAISLFVAKYSQAGGLQWARCFVAYGEGRGVAIDAGGNVLVTGDYGGTVDFGGGAVFSNGQRSIFVVKYSPAGAYLWSRVFGNGGYSLLSSGNGVAVDGAGNVLVTGAFSETVDLGGGPMTALGNSDIFTAKLSGVNGTHLWSRHVGTSVYWNNGGKGIAVDAGGNVVVTGTFGGTADFGAGPVTANGLAIFVTKYSGAGVAVWTKATGGHLDDAGNAVAVDAAGNVVVTGQGANGIDFATGWLFGGGDANVFLVKFSAAGTPQWAKVFGSGAADAGNGVAVDTAGNIVVTGKFGMIADFGGGTLVARGGSDIFVAKFSPDGTHLWSQSFGGLSLDVGRAVAIGGGSAPIVTGEFSGAVSFGGALLTSAGRSDIFLSSMLP
jgi:PKD repeat protein